MKKPNPEELLAAYASGGLDESERERVEAYLEENPEARQELEVLRAVMSEVRDTPEAGPAPQLGVMRASITAALDAVDGERKAGGFWRFLRLPRLTPLLAGAVVAAAAVAVIFVTRGDHRAGPVGTEVATVNPDARDTSGAQVGDSGDDEMLAMQEELFSGDGDEIAELEMLPEEEIDETSEELLAELDELEETSEEEWEEIVLADSDLSWIDELSEEELDLLDAALTELEAS